MMGKNYSDAMAVKIGQFNNLGYHSRTKVQSKNYAESLDTIGIYPQLENGKS